MRRALPIVVLSLSVALSVSLIGCRAKEVADKADISKDLHKRGTVDLMKQVADDKYTPPADGKLTDSQVRCTSKCATTSGRSRRSPKRKRRSTPPPPTRPATSRSPA